MILLRPFKLFRRIVSLVLLVVVAYVAVVAVQVWWTARQDDRRDSDVILVLGASQFDGEPSPVLRSRLEHAKALYDEGVAPRIVTVGGSQPGDRFTEAEAGRRFLVGSGVPADAVVAVESGDDTLSSIRDAAAVMRRHSWDSAVLVTDPPHSLRARTMAEDSGIDAVTSPTRSSPAVHTRSAQLRYIGRETVGTIAFTLGGRG